MRRALQMLLVLTAMTTQMEAQNSFTQSRQGEPASVLVFPLVDSRMAQNRATLVTVTNMNTDRSRPVGSPILRGDVAVHFNYVQGTFPWTWISRRESLTPADTLTVLAAQHAPTVSHGFLIVVAEDPVTQNAIQFNNLAGYSLVLDLANDLAWGVHAWSFQAHPAGTPTPCSLSLGGHPFTDCLDNGGNANGAVDFDGREYTEFPDMLYLPNFMEGKTDMIDGEIVLLSFMSPVYKLAVQVSVFNDQGDSIVDQRELGIWAHLSLFDLTSYANGLGSQGPLTTGWMTIDGFYAVDLATGTLWNSEGAGRIDPPLLGASVQRVLPAGGFGFGAPLASSGGQNGNEFPPDGRN